MASAEFNSIKNDVKTFFTSAGKLVQIQSDKHRAVVEFNFDENSWPNRKKNITGSEVMYGFKLNPRVVDDKFRDNTATIIVEKLAPAILPPAKTPCVIGLFPAKGQEQHTDFLFDALKDFQAEGCHIFVAKVLMFTGTAVPVNGIVMTVSDKMVANRASHGQSIRVYDDSISDEQMKKQFGEIAYKPRAPTLFP